MRMPQRVAAPGRGAATPASRSRDAPQGVPEPGPRDHWTVTLSRHHSLMNQPQGVGVTGDFRKVLLLVIDGLRPDAITPAVMPVLSGLIREGWSAAEAVTVRPSVTVAALTSLATGVSPERHGLIHPRLTSLGRVPALAPLPAVLRRQGVATTVVAPVLGGAARWVTGALLRLGGITRLLPAPPAPGHVIEGATDQLRGNPRPEFVVAYVNDTDIAGHAWGWMSAPYQQAAA